MCAHFTPRRYWAKVVTLLHGVSATLRSLYSTELLGKFEDSTLRSY